MTSPTVEDPTAELLRRLGLGQDPAAELVTAIGDAIADAEADVEGYLDRPITPQQRTATGQWPLLSGWQLPDDDPVRAIISTTPETFPDGTLTGTFTVVYEIGLDYKNDPACRPIRRYVIAAAMNSPQLLQYLTRTAQVARAVKSISVSTEGQSKTTTYGDVSYGGGGAAGSGAPGALPSIKSLEGWSLAGRRVHQAPDRPAYVAAEWRR